MEGYLCLQMTDIEAESLQTMVLGDVNKTSGSFIWSNYQCLKRLPLLIAYLHLYVHLNHHPGKVNHTDQLWIKLLVEYMMM